MTAIVFGGGTGMQGYGLAALLLRDVSGFEEGLMVMVDADADFSPSPARWQHRRP